MNTKPKQKEKNNFEKNFFKLKNNEVFRKTMENIRKHRNIKLVTTGSKINYLVSEQNYHSTNFFTENLLAIKTRKTKTLINRSIYLGLSSKTVMHEFLFDYGKPKYGENSRLCYRDTDSFTFHIKTDNIYKDTAVDVEKRFDTSNFEIDRPLPKRKKNELGEQMMK